MVKVRKRSGHIILLEIEAFNLPKFKSSGVLPFFTGEYLVSQWDEIQELLGSNL